VRQALAALACAAAAAAGPGCDAGTKYIGADNPAAADCNRKPAPPPAGMGADPFYQKYLDGQGIPVLASARVTDEALTSACIIVVRMLAARDDVRRAMIDARIHVAVLARDEVTTDIPEYSDLYRAFPNTDWNALRGLGATTARPVSSCGEENLLCAGNDAYHGENILVQTMSYALRIGIDATDAAFEQRLATTYSTAMAAGLWARTYAQTNTELYFTEGVQDWFDANSQASPPNGRQNEINTRTELMVYDPGLASLVGDYLPHDGWRARCP